MGLNKIIKNLQKLMDSKKKRETQKIEAIEGLVARLEKKAVKYEAKLGSKLSEKEAKKLNRQIKVCAAQLEKGRAALKVLQEEVSE